MSKPGNEGLIASGSPGNAVSPITVNSANPAVTVNQTGAGRIVDFQAAGTSKLYVLAGGRVLVADSIEIGTTPATTGVVRVPNNVGAVVARNSANTADISLIALNNDATNAVEVGGTTGTYVRITTATGRVGLYGITPVAQAAAIAAPTGGATIDAEARTAINSIRTALTNIGVTL